MLIIQVVINYVLYLNYIKAAPNPGQTVSMIINCSLNNYLKV
jgi:hypothetical protein